MTTFYRAVLWAVVASTFYVGSSGPALRFAAPPPFPILT